MTVEQWTMQVRARVFKAVYIPDLDQPDDSPITLGFIGDLRMGSRYAIGLIARREIHDLDATLIGRLGRGLVGRPFEHLRPLYQSLWKATNPAMAFNALVERPQSSLQFEEQPLATNMLVAEKNVSTDTNIETLKAWCITHLREHLQAAYAPLLQGRATSDTTEGNEIDARQLPIAA